MRIQYMSDLHMELWDNRALMRTGDSYFLQVFH